MRESQTSFDGDVSEPHGYCRACPIRATCLTAGFHEDPPHTPGPVRHRRRLEKGATLYHMGDPLHSLYAVRRGCVKTGILTRNGDVQIMGFFLPGEILGLDALGDNRHPCMAVALEPTELCEYPFRQLEQLADEVPALQHRLRRVLGREIDRDNRMLTILGHHNAEARLAACLLNLNERYARLGQPVNQLMLAMSRQDLGDHLGLALETVSRSFTRLQEHGLLRVQGREVHLLDLPALHALGEGGPGHHRPSA